ncbi:MAG: carbon-nitrogen hydrolase family protein [Solirubrobacterales bacterium]|nr:carbon-nitrogen hydrolase family protein [Solirubrobacterales bacterium]
MRAAAVQLNSTEDTQANLAAADKLVREAAGRGAELVLLPEKWSVLGRADVMHAEAQTLTGPASKWAAETAAELGIDLIAGSIVERREGQDRTANTSVHYDPNGNARATYRKLHMFDTEIDGVRYAESEREQPGDRVVRSELKGGAGVGLSICYDLRFPELYRVNAGVEVIVVPSAFTLATTRDHWEVLLRARAVENQAFVIAANQVGSYPPGNRSGGRSMIVDPWGVVLATAPDKPSTVIADLDLEQLAGVRGRLPALTHARPEVYR